MSMRISSIGELKVFARSAQHALFPAPVFKPSSVTPLSPSRRSRPSRDTRAAERHAAVKGAPGRGEREPLTREYRFCDCDPGRAACRRDGLSIPHPAGEPRALEDPYGVQSLTDTDLHRPRFLRKFIGDLVLPHSASQRKAPDQARLETASIRLPHIAHRTGAARANRAR